MKVLLVEDADGMRGLVCSMLKSMGVTDVIQSKHGGEAWDILRKKPVDLLLTDWNMPIVNGIDLIQKIRREPTLDSLSVLMFTGRNTKEDVVTALKAGVDSYIAKPFTPQQLQERIKTILGQRSQRQAERVFNSADPLDFEATHPLIVLGEATTNIQRLGQADNREVLNFLQRFTGTVNKNNTDEEHIGYVIDDSSTSLSKYIRRFNQRIKLLVVSPDLAGGGVTLARLASIHRQDELSVFMLCESINEIPTQARFGLERLGISILERHKLDDEHIHSLLNEYVYAKLREDVPATLPSPEEIHQRLERDIQQMVNLPVLPQVYHRIVALDRDRESDLQGWVEAIETDPLTQAQVIRRARSPVYGFQGDIDDVGKAVTLLGKNTVKELVVSGAIRRSCETVEDQAFNVEEYWLHSVATGIAARLLSFLLDEAKWTPDHKRSFDEFELEDDALKILAEYKLYERFALKPQQDPFIGGMMHDIGKVAMVHAYPGLFPLIVETMEAQGWNRPMSVSEEINTGGLNHSQVGLILGESWKLGDEICRVIESHHRPSADDAFTQLIALANFIAAGAYRYPGQARYPIAPVLQEDDEANEDDVPIEAIELALPEEGPDLEEDLEAVAKEGPSQALRYFLPPGLLDQLELPLGQLIDLGKALTPTVRRLTERLRQG